MKYGIDASYLNDITFIGDEDIKTADTKLIGLVEVDDYVNGEKIIEVIKDGDMSRVKSVDGTFFNNDIKSILTKEMYARFEYKVGDN